MEGAGAVESVILEWTSHYGYLAIFALLMLGIVGLPVPDEVLLVFAGYLVSRGELLLLPTLGSAVAGSACGITLSYAIGRYAGRWLARDGGRRFHVGQPSLDRARDWFHRVGKWGLTVGYFVPGVRHLIAVVAGSSRIGPGAFATFAYAGAILWCGCFVLVGYETGNRWRGLLQSIHRHVVLAVVLLVVSCGIYALIRNRK
jgi:membrane protein DedA with SNARE-associated domain